VEPLALPIRSRFVPLRGHADCPSDWCMPCIPVGRVLCGSAQAGRRACGREGRRIDPRHPIETAREAVTECAPSAAGRKMGAVPWRATLCAGRTLHGRRRMPQGFPMSALGDWIWLSQSYTCRGLVMYLSCTRRVPALVTRRITRPHGPLVAAVSGVPGRLT
jgi:hypothetical protein